MKPKLFKNPTKQDINIPGFGEIKAGEQVSVMGSHLTQAMLMDHPDLVDISDEPGEQPKESKDE